MQGLEVANEAWAFIKRRYGLKDDSPMPLLVYDSTALMIAAHGRRGALAAYLPGRVLLPTNGYSDESLGPILAHEFTHHARMILGFQDGESEAYENQKVFEEESRLSPV